MKPSDFGYHLPSELIAQYPLAERVSSRLLRLDRGSGGYADDNFSKLPGLLRRGDLLVFNDTRVIPARLYGSKDTGGKVEIMVERVLGEHQLLAQMRAGKKPGQGSTITLEGGKDRMVVEGRDGEFFILSHIGSSAVAEVLDKYGHVPLPPYIRREDEDTDRERYQTVYAKHPGAVAAPTAGLHFSRTTFTELEHHGIETGFVTLHVGAGTFQPVRAGTLEEHVMHKEWFSLGDGLCRQVQRVKDNGGRVIAVGTTVVRCLESAAKSGRLIPMTAETGIFIYPGFVFRVIDGLITNFHLPESTLLMLVCAFAGKDNIFRAYQHAVAAKYRFFSYGDAMLIL
jgi:S-adenosylmethionine:tRNA ribosyltransferase-isomerase